MLIFSETRYEPIAVNMLVLKNEHGYFHVHRSLYDKAVILYDQYKAAIPAFRSLLMGAKQRTESDYFFANVPDPINILGYFLDLIPGDDSLGEEMEVLCGAIHVMSMSLDFRQFLKVDARLRTSVRFSLSIKEEYQIQWDRFFAEALPFDAVQAMRDSGSHHSKSRWTEEDEDEDEEEEVEQGEFLFDDEPLDLASIRRELAAEQGTEVPVVATTSVPLTQPLPVTQTQQAPSVGLDLVRQWGGAK